MEQIAHDQELIKTISLKSPVRSDDMTAPKPVLVPLFEALANTTRATRIGSVAKMGSQFSTPLPYNTDDGLFFPIMIKAPNTDFHLPVILEQFLPAIEQIIFAQYNGTASSPHLRSGREYCVIKAEQRPSEMRESFEEVANQHFDIPQDAVADTEIEIVDRYIVTDIADLTTGFYDADFDVNNGWDGDQGKLIRASGATPHQHDACDIIHFDSSTPHAVFRGPELRMLFTVSFSATPFNGCEFSTAVLKEAYKQLKPSDRSDRDLTP